jgi:NADH-quinone oxidoreductase subunit G
VEGRWQSWVGAATPVGESRPGWKVLRVLANLLHVPGVEYLSSEEIRDELNRLCGTRLIPPTGADSAAVTGTAAVTGAAPASTPPGPNGRAEANGQPVPGAWIDIPPYQVDVLVRGSESLAKTQDGRAARAVL